MARGFTVIVIDPIHKSGIDILKKHAKVIQLPIGSSQKDLLKVAELADAFVTRTFIKIPKEILERAKKLKVIGVHGVGVDHIDLQFAQKKGIKIVRTPEALTDAVAEFTVGLLLSLLRKIPKADVAVRNGRWEKKYADLVGVDLKSKIVGIIGLGRIGSAVAKKLSAFEVQLIYNKRVRAIEAEKQLGLKYMKLDQLLKKSDIISIHVPLTSETYHMISRKEFGLMRKGVYIVNTSRGAVIDEKELCNVLVSGKVAGAALDVFESEPLSLNSPLMKLDNVILAPHLAACSQEALTRMSTTVATEVVNTLRSS